jgi:hypothetical protein
VKRGVVATIDAGASTPSEVDWRRGIQKRNVEKHRLDRVAPPSTPRPAKDPDTPRSSGVFFSVGIPAFLLRAAAAVVREA